MEVPGCLNPGCGGLCEEGVAQAMEVAVGLLHKCTTAGQLAVDRRLHAALRLLLDVKAQLAPAPGTVDGAPRLLVSCSYLFQGLIKARTEVWLCCTG